MWKEWWSTPIVAWAFSLIGLGGSVLLALLSPYVGIPIGAIVLAFGIFLLIRAYRKKGGRPKHPYILKLVKLFHDGKDYHSKLKMAQNNTSITEQVSAQLHFESWFADVTNAIKNSGYKKMWYEYEVVNCEKDSISEYLSASARALERLESIMKIISHKNGPVTFSKADEKEEATAPSKRTLVVKAILEARDITPKDKDIAVYITDANGLTQMCAEELKDILLKLQDEKVLILKTFPDWLLSSYRVTKEKINKIFEAALEPSIKNFTVRLLSGFEGY